MRHAVKGATVAALVAAAPVPLLLACAGAPSWLRPPPRYAVTAGVMAQGRLVRACHGSLLSLPSPMCGGVDVRGLDPRSIPGGRVQSNGILLTPAVRLVGTWDGHSLTLTEPPIRAASTRPPTIERCSGPGNPRSDASSLPARISADATLAARGIQLLSVGVGPCPGTVTVEVAVADAKTVSYLQDRYGEVEVAGWLQPL